MNLGDSVAAVASDGTNFLLVTHHSSLGSPYTMNWVGTLLARDGTIIKTFDITPPINPVATKTEVAVAAYDGSNYLVVYVPNLNPRVQPDTLEALRISPSGAILPPRLGAAVTVAPAIAANSSCAVAFDGTNYLLVYLPYSPTSNVNLVGEYLSASTGQPLGPSFPIAPAPCFRLPSDSRSPEKPLPSANTCPCRLCRGLSPPSGCALPGAP